MKKSREEQLRKQEEKNKLLELETEEKPLEEHIEEIDNPDIEEILEISTFDENEIERPEDWIEIGTWTNEMADKFVQDNQIRVRYASPTSWITDNNAYDDFSYTDSDLSEADTDCEYGGLRIEFTGDHQAEAVDDDLDEASDFFLYDDNNVWEADGSDDEKTEFLKKEFHDACVRNKEKIFTNGTVIRAGSNFEKTLNKDSSKNLDLKLDLETCDFSSLFVDETKLNIRYSDVVNVNNKCGETELNSVNGANFGNKKCSSDE